MKITRTKITAAVATEAGFEQWMMDKKGTSKKDVSPAKWEELGTRFFSTFRDEVATGKYRLLADPVESSITADTSTVKWWMAKYFTPDGEKKKVYFAGPTSFRQAEKLFKEWIPEPFTKALLLGGIPSYSDKQMQKEGFEKIRINSAVESGAEESETNEDDLEQVDQEFTSKDTSINSAKLPAIYKLVNFPKGSVVLDFGGGKFDNGIEYLESIGCKGYVYDPYNRDQEYNRATVRAIRENGGADIVLNSNVLNVIQEEAARINVLKNIRKLCKPSGKVYITVYEGKGTGEGKQSKEDSYQLNRKTADYMEEIQRVFPDATRKGKLISATPTGEVTASEEITSGRKYKTDHINRCPHCTNMTLVEVEDGTYVCEECGAEFHGYPAFEGGLELEEIGEGIEAAQNIESALVEPPQEVVDSLLNILSDFNFELDDRFNVNPGRTWMDNIHLQVINKKSHVDDPSELKMFVTKELRDKIHKLSESSNCPITWNFGADDNGNVTGGLDIQKQWIPDESNVESACDVESASYGGAYDIEDDQYFTKEELVEFGDSVSDKVCEITNHEYFLESIYVTNNVLDIEVTDNDITNQGTVRIDMRKIRKPSDIYKYKDILVKQLVDAHKEYFGEEVESACGVEAAVIPNADIHKVMLRAVDVHNHEELMDVLTDLLSIDPKLYQHACDMDQSGEYSPASIGKAISNELYWKLDKGSVDSSCDVEAAYAPYKKTEFVKKLQDELYNQASATMQGDYFGFPLEEIADYLTIEVSETADGVVAEVRAELDYEGMSRLSDDLNPIVQRYDKDAYFDMVDPGIMEAFLRMKFADTYVNSAEHINYDDPIKVDSVFDVEFSQEVIVKDDIASWSDEAEFEDLEDNEYGYIRVDDGDGVAEKILDLIVDNIPEEPGKYRVSGIAKLNYELSNIYSVYNDPDRPGENGYYGYDTQDAESDYDYRSSWVEDFQAEKI